MFIFAPLFYIWLHILWSCNTSSVGSWLLTFYLQFCGLIAKTNKLSPVSDSYMTYKAICNVKLNLQYVNTIANAWFIILQTTTSVFVLNSRMSLLGTGHHHLVSLNIDMARDIYIYIYYVSYLSIRPGRLPICPPHTLGRMISIPFELLFLSKTRSLLYKNVNKKHWFSLRHIQVWHKPNSFVPLCSALVSMHSYPGSASIFQIMEITPSTVSVVCETQESSQSRQC